MKDAESMRGSVRDWKTADTCWFPLYCALVLCDTDSCTIERTKGHLARTFEKTGMRGMATTVKRWARCVRVILANEDSTRVAHSPQNAGFAKKARNWAHEVRSRNLCSESCFQEIVREQGNREIPPYLLDPKHIRALSPDATRVDLERLVIPSNTGRTVPSPDGTEKIRSLEKFRTLIETEPRHVFRVRSVVERACRTGLRSVTRRDSHWSIASTASGDYTRGMGGKTQEIVDKIIGDFLVAPVTRVCPSRPTKKLKDITGTLALDPEDWEPDKRVCDVLFKSFLTTGATNAPDNRLGHIGLLWALHELRFAESCEFVGNEWAPFLWEEDTEIEMTLESACLQTRVTGVLEEGWKCRVITITSMAATIVGHVARHLMDPILWSSIQISIGLKDKVKLWSFLRHMGPNGPMHAESVDLTTATDSPTRLVVRDTLDGFTDFAVGGKSKEQTTFLRLAVQIASSDRDFIPEKGAPPCPRHHRRGIMMGEPLSGVFLNAMSLTVRSMHRVFSTNFPELDSNRPMTNGEIDAWLDINHQAVQAFLDEAPLDDHITSTQSGDDVVAFGAASVSNSIRACYRIFEMMPSETTWFSSKRYALFTEEVAIQLPDGQGWKFIDAPKPRLFADTAGDPDGQPILGKLGQITGYLRYIVEERPDSPMLDRAIALADRLIARRRSVYSRVMKHDMPVGLPRCLGGIDHPVGLKKGYVSSLREDYLDTVNRYMDLTCLELIELEYEPEETRGVDPDILKQYVLSYVKHVMENPEKCVSRQSLFDELPDGRKNFRSMNQLAKTRGLSTVYSQIGTIEKRLMFDLLLKGGKLNRTKVRPITAISRRFERTSLKLANHSIGRPRIWELGEIKKRVSDRKAETFFPDFELDLWVEGLDLPSMRVSFRRATDVGPAT